MPEKELKKPIRGSEKSFPCLLRVFLTRGGRLANPGQHGGREHPTRDAGIPCMHAHWEQKGPLGPGSRTCKVDFTPAKNVCRVFFGPSLDLRGRFQTHQTTLPGFLWTRASAALGSIRTPHACTGPAEHPLGRRGGGLQAYTRPINVLHLDIPLLMCTLPQGNPASRRAEGIKKTLQRRAEGIKKTLQGPKKTQALTAEVFFDPRMGCFQALTATGFFSGPGSPATVSFSGPANPLEFCF